MYKYRICVITVTKNIYVWNVIKSATNTYHTTDFRMIAQNLLAGYYQVVNKFHSIVMKSLSDLYCISNSTGTLTTIAVITSVSIKLNYVCM